MDLNEKQKIKQDAAGTKERNIPFYLDKQAVLSLIERIAGPKYSDSFIIAQLQPVESGMDRYIVSDSGDQISIQATSGVAAVTAFNWYLQNRCDSYIGPLTKRVNLPANPPKVGGTHKDTSVFLYRYFLNFCTYGYTMPFWNWPEWEPFIDWMMLSGYNLILNPVGNEEVWRRLLTGLGYTDDRARAFLSAPCFYPWQCMMNITSWGGAAPQSWYDGHVQLAARINRRLKSFGAGIVLPGFSGMVPTDFNERFSESKPLSQGDWCAFERPGILLPEDPYFDRVADAYYQAQIGLFGNDFHYFSTDPFHEGGDARKVDLPRYGKAVHSKMAQYYENAVWFLQGWQSNPSRELLRGMKPSSILIGNLRAEDKADGGDNFADYPWLYCTVNNFGGQRLLRGNMKKWMLEPHLYAESPGHTMVGIGIMPEGVSADEIFFDILSDMSIRKSKARPNAWLNQYLAIRYGDCPPKVFAGWKILMEKVYIADTSTCPKESALCTRPSLTADMVTSYSQPEFTYPPEMLVQALLLIHSGFSALQDAEPYRFDLADFARQALANKAWEYLTGLQQSYQSGRYAAFEQYASRFLSVYPIQDRLTGTHRHMMLGPWLQSARSHGRNPAEKAYYEFLARTILTLWGDRNASETGGLRDYAAREWNGLLMDFYYKRWQSYINMLRVAFVTGGEIREYNRYDGEYFFTTLSRDYPTSPQGNLQEILWAVTALLTGENG